ncbi:MAG: helix-turn-helix domain-containing protein [Pseudonocardia sp.]|jgi:excisionase family DNA binding protein
MPDDTGNAPPPVPGGAQHAAEQADETLDLLTVAEVAAMLRLSKMTIYRLMDKGRLPALRVGRSFRIPRDSVHALLEESSHLR